MKAKHVIHVSSYYPPHLGGQENAVYDLTRHLAAAGHHVDVLTSTQGDGPKGVTRESKVNVNRLPGFVFGHAPVMPSFPGALFRAVWPDSIVHIHIGQAFTPEMVWLVSKLRRFKYVAQLHINFEPSGPAGILLPLYKRFLLKRVLQSAAAVVTLNETTLRIVRETYGYQGEAHILNNGIEEAYFTLRRSPFKPKPPKTLRLLFVGRLSGQKNVLKLIEALQHTKRKVHLDIVGEGDQFAAIKQAIASAGLTNVTMHGRRTRQQVMQFYRTCDALIMPSLYEAQPLVLLEAMAARVPIIGTNVIGVAEHIAGSGIIVEPTAQGLANGIEQYDALYASLPDMIAKGYEAAEGFRWPRTLNRYERLYETILAG